MKSCYSQSKIERLIKELGELDTHEDWLKEAKDTHRANISNYEVVAFREAPVLSRKIIQNYKIFLGSDEQLEMLALLSEQYLSTNAVSIISKIYKIIG